MKTPMPDGKETYKLWAKGELPSLTRPPEQPIQMDKSWIALIDKLLGPHGSNAFGGGAYIVKAANEYPKLIEAIATTEAVRLQETKRAISAEAQRDELLAALKGVVEVADSAMWDKAFGAETIARFMARCVDARSAISKIK